MAGVLDHLSGRANLTSDDPLDLRRKPLVELRLVTDHLATRSASVPDRRPVLGQPGARRATGADRSCSARSRSGWSRGPRRPPVPAAPARPLLAERRRAWRSNQSRRIPVLRSTRSSGRRSRSHRLSQPRDSLGDVDVAALVGPVEKLKVDRAGRTAVGPAGIVAGRVGDLGVAERTDRSAAAVVDAHVDPPGGQAAARANGLAYLPCAAASQPTPASSTPPAW